MGIYRLMLNLWCKGKTKYIPITGLKANRVVRRQGFHIFLNSGIQQFLFAHRLCGLVVRVPGYRCRGPGSIPGATDFQRSSGSETRSPQPREYN
jgi:hypothetical protein